MRKFLISLNFATIGSFEKFLKSNSELVKKKQVTGTTGQKKKNEKIIKYRRLIYETKHTITSALYLRLKCRDLQDPSRIMFN